MEQLSLDIGENTNSILTEQNRTEQNRTEQNSRPQTLAEKVEKAKKALRLAAQMSQAYYKEPLIVTYSGGKDSDVLLHLAKACLKPDEFEVLNSHTTVDAPETVYHIREVFKELNEMGVKTTIDYHKNPDGTNKTMWSLIMQNRMPPTRIARYCCKELKETGTPNRLGALGVRAAESTNRQGRDTFYVRGMAKKPSSYYSLEHAEEVHQESQEIQDDNWDCILIKSMKEHKDTMVNPIYEWLDEDIWNYIKSENINVNPLYSKGYQRVGCIGCPLAGAKMREKEFADYPKYKQMYINAFDKMLKIKKSKGNEKKNWENGEEVFAWWIEKYKKIPKGQMSLFKEEL